MNETKTRSGSALDNALWPLKYANENPAPIDAKPISVEGAKQMLRAFDAAFPEFAALRVRGVTRMRDPQYQQIPRSK